MASFSILSGFKMALNGIIPPGYEELITGQDLVIKFLSAEVCFAYSKKNLFLIFSRIYQKWILSVVLIRILLSILMMKYSIRNKNKMNIRFFS
jgi:hypothetical protein